jgi:hypothetical protein
MIKRLDLGRADFRGGDLQALQHCSEPNLSVG